MHETSPPQSASPFKASKNIVSSACGMEHFAPMSSANDLNSPAHALMSDVQLLQCTIATGLPVGVVTMSISVCTLESAFSSTIIAKTDVPAEILPVRTRTLFVAVMPVPASPSGGHSGAPGFKVPVGSSKSAPASVSSPASSPARRICGRMSRSRHGRLCSLCRISNVSIMPESYTLCSLSMGNMPEASPMPSTFSPVSFQCT